MAYGSFGGAIAGNGSYGFGTSNAGDLHNGPDQHVPNSGAQVTPLQPPSDDTTRQNFMSQNLTAPYYNAAAVAGNLGTLTGQVAPAAANFMQGLFSNNLNPMEQTFMQAGLGSALAGMNQGFQRQEAQFEDTPFHSGLPRAQGDVMEQMMRDMLQTGSQLGLQREQLASQQAQFPFEFTQQAAQVPVQMEQGLFNQANAAFNAPYQLPLSVWSGYPVTGPSTVVQQGGNKPF